MTAAALLGRAVAAITAATTPSELKVRTRFLVADVLACAVSAWARPELAAPSVAGAIVGGSPRPDRFRPEVLSDPSFTSLAGRVRVVHDPTLDAGYPDGRPAVVTATMTDGTVREARSERPRGDGPGAPADQVVAVKPRRLLAAAAGGAGADSVIEAIDGLDERGIAPLSGALRRLRLGRHPPLPRPADTESARTMSASQYTSESR